MTNSKMEFMASGNIYPNYMSFKPSKNNPLVGSWSITETMIDQDGASSTSVETYTFYRNGVLRWKETIDGDIILVERGTYTIARNRLLAHYAQKNISEEAFFYIIDNKISLQFDFWKEPTILTKQ